MELLFHGVGFFLVRHTKMRSDLDKKRNQLTSVDAPATRSLCKTLIGFLSGTFDTCDKKFRDEISGEPTDGRFRLVSKYS